ncbi:Hypp8270 [Branchiostoma lanceolatum]|uniref:Hypp8270 protein n=1 Tax=Branchiostoma lanceolatum TaxID=7740 RepID=A0A8J9Z843_BRALA|nr:Hypp8270 [Branchiostoma lanceolatum]
MPSQAALIRRVNRVKAKMRHAEPKDKDFELANDFVPDDFLIGDINVEMGRNQEQARLLIFATPYQLKKNVRSTALVFIRDYGDPQEHHIFV